jgi:hypothetical protein
LSVRYIVFLSLWSAVVMAAPPHRRALLVGINDYSASHLPHGRTPPVADRGLVNLAGAVNDITTMRDMLVQSYGFTPADVIVLPDQAATRAAILQKIESHLLQPAAPGDIIFFYYSGHGSQVRNRFSNETDHLDESIVPADSRLGAPDIRDKELRRLFNRILDRGAHLTVVLDSCHSGSGVRDGLDAGLRARGVKPDLRDVGDGAPFGPRPENHGALVIAASQDFDRAYELIDEHRMPRGAFSWTWTTAMADALPGEPASQTFLRAQARLRNEMPAQKPVMAGTATMRQASFLGATVNRYGMGTVVGIERLNGDGTLTLRGGWANGLAVGSQLQLVSAHGADIRFEVIEVEGLVKCKARILNAPVRASPELKSGALAKIVSWAAPQGRPLRVWLPSSPASAAEIAESARAMAAAAARRNVRWIGDPTESMPTRVVRWRNGWERVDADGTIARFAAIPDALAGTPSSIFVQMPAPMALVRGIKVGNGTNASGIEPVDRPEMADYILVGRLANRGVEYAWVRPGVGNHKQRGMPLPVRTNWMRGDAKSLTEAVLALRRLHAWQHLESPPETRSRYRLGIRRASDGQLVTASPLQPNAHYKLVLRATPPLPADIPPRFFYVFSIDSSGKGVLLFPLSGSVENRFPLTRGMPPAEIDLDAPFHTLPPFGADTYLLLSSDEPLPDPYILEWDGVKTRAFSDSPLERLLAMTISSSRAAAPLHISQIWSIERIVLETLSPTGGSSR